jgi:hypothetical protein
MKYDKTNSFEKLMKILDEMDVSYNKLKSKKTFQEIKKILSEIYLRD